MAINSNQSNLGIEISEKSDFPKLFGVLFIIIFIALSVYGAKYMLNPNTLPIKHVKVEGAFNRLSQNELKKNVVNNIQGGFFNINVDKVRLALLNMPWVKDVTVKRVWPDSLKVIVNEQIPSARWGDLGLLNESGVFFSPDDKTIPNNLPLLFGPANSETKLLNRYRDIQKKLQSLPFRLNVSSVALNDRRAWSFNLENDLRVIIGRYSFDERLNRFLKFIPSLIPDGINKVELIDLRYSNGLSVRSKNNFNISSN